MGLTRTTGHGLTLAAALISIASYAMAEEKTTITTFYPAPFGEYDEIRANKMTIANLTTTNSLVVNSSVTASQFIDKDNPAFVVDPSGTSVFNTIRMTASGPFEGKLVFPDIAENFPTTSGGPCDVVVIDGEKDGCLKPSQIPYDPHVAGVISENPWLLLGAERTPSGEASHPNPVALMGQVRCRVTDQGGPIQRGDLLVTSSTPGCAMRGDPAKISPGTLIGKALQPHEKGEGKILVLVALQ